jgi:hypothetical protein
MMVRWMRPGPARDLFAAGLIAASIVSLTGVSASAFTRENVSPDGGNYSFGDPDKQPTTSNDNTSSQGTRPFGSTGPTVQFGVQQGPVSNFGQSNRYTPPDPYFGALKGN